MTDSVQEQISACLDGELPRAELDLLLKRVGRDAALGESMGRYALVGEALRAEKPVVASRAFAANVMAALEKEPAVARRPAARISPALMRRLRPVAGMAIAAGVAAVVVFSVQQAGVAPQRVANTETVTAPDVVSAVDSSSYVVPTTTSAAAFVPAMRLTNYVVAHSEYSSPLGRSSVLSSVLAEDDTHPSAADDAAVVEPQPQER